MHGGNQESQTTSRARKSRAKLSRSLTDPVDAVEIAGRDVDFAFIRGNFTRGI